MRKHMNVKQIADYLNCTVQAVYQAIWRGRLRAIKLDDQRLSTKEWVDEYTRTWKSKQHSVYNGMPTFNKEKGEYSIKTASQAFDIKEQRLYHLIREGRLPCTRKGCYVVLHHDELSKFIEKELGEQKHA